MDEWEALTLKTWPQVWCDNCEALRPLVVGDGDLVCGHCHHIAATLHKKPPAPSAAVRKAARPRARSGARSGDVLPEKSRVP